MSLSERIRPNIEAAPWVCEKVKKLERKNAAMREAIREAHEAGRACEDTLEETGWPDCAQRLSDSLSKLQPFLKS